MQYALTIEQLKKTYAGGVQALSGVDLTIKEGEFFALLGPNGAGKSTTIGIISSLVKKTSGFVSVFNHNMDHSLTKAKRLLGIVPQEFNCNQFETVQNILETQAGYYGLSVGKSRPVIKKYLKKLGLWEYRDKVSRTLSGGMKRRLMIVRALLHHPKILILDEPTAGVDIELRRSLWEFVKEVNKEGVTIILTTHYLEEAENFCRNVAIIDKGNIIENTTMKNLLGKLKKESFVLDLKESITKIPNFAGHTVKRTDTRVLEVEIDKYRGFNDFFKQLNEYSIEVDGMRNKANRLEEMFIKLTRESG